MNKFLASIVVVATPCLAVGGWGMVVAAADGGPDRAEVLPFARLELTARLDQGTYVAGQPLGVYARLANRNALPAQAHGSWGWFRRGGTCWQAGDVYLAVELTREAKSLRLLRPYGMPWAGKTGAQARRIPAGGVWQAKQFLVWGDSKMDEFLAAGELELRVTFRGPGASHEALASNGVKIVQKAPAGMDAAAFRWLSERKLLPYLGYHLFMDKRQEARVAEEFEAFMAGFPETTYTPYARFALGQAYYYGRQHLKAIGCFEAVARQYPKFSLAEDALFLLAECHRVRSQPATMAWALREILRRYPETPAAEDAEEILTNVRRYPEVLFPDDRRLDQRVACAFGDGNMPLEEAFVLVGRMTGVPLDVAPELRGRWKEGGSENRSLRRFMVAQLVRRNEYVWVPTTDGGYRLEIDPKAQADASPR
ncbi:MAG: tetratricopeptide repeat protein [Thermoguttaceae bacterium]|jgi:tetratricopeptide (TPR) repeat protein|nr:tetratricopeptide repeat protein [Thermoguttaceae bacterium]